MTRTLLPAAIRQEGIETAYRNFVADQGDEPTVRQLADRVGVTPSTISLHLRLMRERGIDLPTRGHRQYRSCPHCGGEL
ncbi:ArsR family transcriptional regulator [Streptomyces sp. NPDC050145]|uniref:ArsR family transcriptional regulator n=1 Tax=Streptomyces sp. NPDC050145 TaxID=3365602 RepID=UPI0037AC35AE